MPKAFKGGVWLNVDSCTTLDCVLESIRSALVTTQDIKPNNATRERLSHAIKMLDSFEETHPEIHKAATFP